ncbi:tyrosine-type recombinase/integrase [Streptomyces sp. NPDC001714]|uniref:tyrosine-type recombinase/integrase n=1 Tax=Streptomyces sp. NPDC001714 TaxID=3364603 RepID=UPI0036C22EEA
MLDVGRPDGPAAAPLLLRKPLNASAPQRPEGADEHAGALWIDARKDAGVTVDAHFHDLRHTGNTLAASGASLRELMTRMGHSTPRAALIYQHMVNGRDREIADRLGSMIRKERGDGD